MTERDVLGDLHVLGDLPTEFRGCQWDAGWEYDAPAVVYYPGRYRRYDYGSNPECIDDMVAWICDAIIDGPAPTDGGLAEECKDHGLGPRFDRRRNAWHVVIRVRWFWNEYGSLEFERISRRETWGPPSRGKKSTPALPIDKPNEHVEAPTNILQKESVDYSKSMNRDAGKSESKPNPIGDSDHDET